MEMEMEMEMDSVAWRIGVRGGPSQPLRRGSAVVGWGPTSVTAYLPWPRGVTPSLDTISFMACGLVFKADLLAWPGCLARGGSCLAGEAR